jgi:hypothetical protein
MNYITSFFSKERGGATSDPSGRGGSERLPGYSMEYYKSRQGSTRHPYSFVEDAPTKNESNVSMAYVAVFVVAIIVLIVAVVKK